MRMSQKGKQIEPVVSGHAGTITIILFLCLIFFTSSTRFSRQHLQNVHVDTPRASFKDIVNFG